jgi:hypothetical protein
MGTSELKKKLARFREKERGSKIIIAYALLEATS